MADAVAGGWLMSALLSDQVNDVDLFSDEVLADPYPVFAALRDAGPAVRLSQLDMWFLGRYDIVKNALHDWETFSSAQGVGITAQFNDSMASALICLDPPAHTEQRKLFTDRLSLRALRPIADTIEERAREMVRELSARPRFDAVKDLAHDLPVNVIMDLIGWPVEVRDRLIPMAIAWFETIGPMNERSQNAWPTVAEMVAFVSQTAREGNLHEGSFGHHMLEAYHAGAIPFDAVVGLLVGYIVAAFDTTINAMSSAMVLFARHPDQWAALQANPDLARNAFSEVLRFESPIQYFTRVTTREVDLGDGIVLPVGARVLISYGSANRDERHFEHADRFDISRPVVDQLAFSYGRHACAGQSLARLEGEAILNALIAEAQELVLLDEPVLALNNAGRGYASVPMRLA